MNKQTTSTSLETYRILFLNSFICRSTTPDIEQIPLDEIVKFDKGGERHIEGDFLPSYIYSYIKLLGYDGNCLLLPENKSTMHEILVEKISRENQLIFATMQPVVDSFVEGYELFVSEDKK